MYRIVTSGVAPVMSLETMTRRPAAVSPTNSAVGTPWGLVANVVAL